MENTHLTVLISAENKEQADTILNRLLEKKLVTGGQMISAPARFWWKGKIEDMNYFTITSYTLEKHKDALVNEVRRVTVEEFPMIQFIPLDGNKELHDWIDDTLE